MGLTMQPSPPALDAVGRAMESKRDLLVSAWVNWVSKRLDSQTDRQSLERHLGLLVDILIQMAGPLRRSATELWYSACQSHGNASASRGLAAGEVVEELQHLRELLIRHLAEITAALPARQYLATVLRLNRFVDKGIAHAVVGYTDSLVETLFEKNGVPIAVQEDVDLDRRLSQFEAELETLRKSKAATP
jgi:hypothetical protein